MMFLFLSLLAGATALDFQGTGQLRTLQGYPQGDQLGIDRGCLTVQGEWTVDETLCDIFSGVREDNYTISITTSTGLPCGRDNIDFVCREGLAVQSTIWMLWFGGVPEIPGRDILGAGEYGLFSTNEDYVPENVSDKPVSISYYGPRQPQPWVFLGWQAE